MLITTAKIKYFFLITAGDISSQCCTFTVAHDNSATCLEACFLTPDEYLAL